MKEKVYGPKMTPFPPKGTKKTHTIVISQNM